jgi:peptidylprolyl isomerase
MMEQKSNIHDGLAATTPSTGLEARPMRQCRSNRPRRGCSCSFWVLLYLRIALFHSAAAFHIGRQRHRHFSFFRNIDGLPHPLAISKAKTTITDVSYHDEKVHEDEKSLSSDEQRRRLVSFLLMGSCFLTLSVAAPTNAAAVSFWDLRGAYTSGSPAAAESLYALSPKRNTTTVRKPLVDSKLLAFDELSSELCLLRLLPVKNPFFRELQSTIESVSLLRVNNSPEAWFEVNRTIHQRGVTELDKKRSRLEPVFDPEQDSAMQISKAERFETLIESLRTLLLELANATAVVNATETFAVQKQTLLRLSEIGELLVSKFPYEVPSDGKYSYLPRLLGRCKVSFTFRRKKRMLGQMTMIADGFTAPITAGNFVDLCARNFYTGLPVKFSKRRLAGETASDFEVANLPILGSYGDGFFYDPLTARPRLLPLELIRVQNSNGEPDLTYLSGLSTLSGSKVESTESSRPLLSFKIPGLVAMNHPDKKPNGASTEFFSLQKDSILDDKRRLLDGEYAPFGYIIDGLDVFQKLRAGDVIEETKVSEYGVKTLVKLRRSSFSEMASSKRPNDSDDEDVSDEQGVEQRPKSQQQQKENLQ